MMKDSQDEASLDSYEIRHSLQCWLEKSQTVGVSPTDPEWPKVLDWAVRGHPDNDNQREIRQFILEMNALIHRRDVVKAGDKSIVLRRVIQTRRRRRVIAAAPASTLMSLGRLLLSKDAYKRYVEAHIADIHFEYFAALKANRAGLARWILVRGYLNVFRPFFAGVVATIRALWRISGA